MKSTSQSKCLIRQVLFWRKVILPKFNQTKRLSNIMGTAVLLMTVAPQLNNNRIFKEKAMRILIGHSL